MEVQNSFQGWGLLPSGIECRILQYRLLLGICLRMTLRLTLINLKLPSDRDSVIFLWELFVGGEEGRNPRMDRSPNNKIFPDFKNLIFYFVSMFLLLASYLIIPLYLWCLHASVISIVCYISPFVLAKPLCLHVTL